MRIVIDMQGAQSFGSRHRGIGRYSTSFTKALIKNRDKHEIIILLNGSFQKSLVEIRKDFADILPKENIIVWYPQENNYNISKLIREAVLFKLDADIVIVSSLFENENNAAVSISHLDKKINTAVILYDLIPYIYQDIYLLNQNIKNEYLEKIEYLKKADLLLSISESSRQEAINYIDFNSNNVINISTASDNHFTKVNISDIEKNKVSAKYNLYKPFIMYTGGIDYRKNIDNLILAYSKLPNNIRHDYQLAIICSIREQDKNKLTKLVLQAGLNTDQVIFTGFIEEQDLITLYNLCYLFVFPSWHEGFGLPALEAMQCGAPVIASNVSSLPEVVGLQEALFNPHSIDDITQKIQQVIENPSFRIQLIAHNEKQVQKFSWDKSALSAINALENYYENCKKNEYAVKLQENLEHKRKLAYISPIPNAKSGIADYSEQLLVELAKYYDIHLIINQNDISQDLKSKYTIHNTAWFKENYTLFDRVLYHFGNSEFHQHMFELLPQITGVVVLHDFFLSGICSYLEMMRINPNSWATELYNSYGYLAVKQRYIMDKIHDVIFKYPCNFSVLKNAAGVISHSKYAKNLAYQYYGGSNLNNLKTWEIIPLLRFSNLKQDKINIRQSLNADDSFIVCSFGILGRTKQNLSLLQAWFSSDLASNTKCKLIFVGNNDENSIYGTEILSFIKKNDKHQQIKITGWVDSNTFKNYLTIADLSVQLRSLSRGETSAAVLDAMNYAIPTIINANGAMAELPQDSVYMLEDKFNNMNLAAAINKLYHDEDLRNKLSLNARQYIINNHSPEKCAKKYYEAIENFYAKKYSMDEIIQDVDDKNDLQALENIELQKIAHTLSLNFTNAKSAKQVLIDVSCLVNKTLDSINFYKIRELVLSLLNNQHKFSSYRIEPVYIAKNEISYKYARDFVFGLFECHNAFSDDFIEYSKNDIFLKLDIIINKNSMDTLDTLENMFNIGMKMYFMIKNQTQELQNELLNISNKLDITILDWQDNAEKLMNKLTIVD